MNHNSMDDQLNAEEYLAGWKRAQADYANLKKDLDRERSEFAKFANGQLLAELLPAFDQFENAMAFLPDLSHLPEPDRMRLDNWIHGIRAVQALWESTFKSVGLERVGTDGIFNPNVHEAVGHEAREDVPSETVVHVVQAGWVLHGRLLRPARVIISNEKASA